MSPNHPHVIACKELHAKATLVDLHAHPSLKVSLFRRSLSRATGSSRGSDVNGNALSHAMMHDRGHGMPWPYVGTAD